MSDAPSSWRPGRAAWVAIALIAALFACLAVRNAVQAATHQAAPAVANELWPDDGLALSNQAQTRLAQTGAVDEDTRALYRAALYRAPLLGAPLALAGLDAAARGDGARAEQLMDMARARDPRLLLVRAWLLQRFAGTGRIDAAITEATVAARLYPAATRPLLDLLGALATDPEGQAALTRALRKQPAWRTPFFLTAARGLDDPAVLLEMQDAAPPPPGSRSAAAERRAVLQAMIDAGEGAAAYAAWRRALPPGTRVADAIVYDGGFAGLPGDAPFNWQLTGGRNGSATRMARGGLAITAPGARRAVLATQAIRLAPGDYRLTVTARRTGAPTSATLAAEILCVDTGDVAQLPLELGPALAGYALPLAVGEECPVARLRLVSVPDGEPRVLKAEVTGVSITPAG